jgi:MarR-like DNA-binding transcriptional regulator SgrR of sgrS sRNA
MNPNYNSGVRTMSNLTKIFVLLLIVVVMFSIKTNYGGNITIKLNEPSSFSFSSSNYSDFIFSSLIHENFFYLKDNRDIVTHIFKDYRYDKNKKTIFLKLKENLSFSNGEPITIKDVKNSLNSFLNQNLLSSKKMRKIIKKIYVEKDIAYIELLYDNPDALTLMTAPELILLSEKYQVFTGLFHPAEWVKNQYLILRPNKFYSGGRAYIEYIKVSFSKDYFPDVFLANPGTFSGSGYNEFKSGIYENIYICFPEEKIGQNSKIAFYTLLRQYYKSVGLTELNSLTSDEESPVSINIRKLSNRRMRSILRYSKIELYIISSLKGDDENFKEFLRKKGLEIDTIYVSGSNLQNLLDNNPIKYLLIQKLFKKKTLLEEKINKIVREMSFKRFNEKYLKLINELDEVKFLKNEELLIDQISKIIDKIINDGFIYPVAQKRYSIVMKNKIKGIEMDYYGRPLFQKARLDK